MLNPETGLLAAYEEVWEDVHIEQHATVTFLRNKAGTVWRARVGHWELAMGRRPGGNDGEAFWAWQGAFKIGEGVWELVYKSGNIGEEEGRHLPGEVTEWVEGSDVQWNADVWAILETA
jgi:hypothetical protein